MECRHLLAGDLQITEFMAANDTTLPDGDGSSSDWIEVHNPTPAAVSLTGWALTDDGDSLDKWRFPDATIPADGYLVVFASGKDRGLPELHTNFKLSADGEYLALVSPAGLVVSEFGRDGTRYPPQSSDISYGTPPDGGAPGYLAAPTPGAANTVRRAPAVAFDRPSGVFTEPFSVTLSVDTPGAVIHFTTDGLEPTEASPVYTDPIAVASTTLVQAIAVEPGTVASRPASAWYVTIGADLRDDSPDLPVVVLDSFGQGAPAPQDEWFHFSAMVIFEPDEDSGRTSFLDAPTVATRSGLKVRGSGSSRQPKRPYSVEIWDDRDNDTPISLLGMPGESDWILYAPYNADRSLLNNSFIFELSNQVGRYAVRTRFVELYHNTDGGDVSAADYRGLYVLMEKPKLGPDRVDIEQLEPHHEQEPEVTGGWILKIDHTADPGDVGFTAAGQTLFYVDPKEADLTTAQADWIKNYLNEMYAALGDTSPETGYAQYIDVDSWIDHHILNVLAKNVDGLRLSTFIYKDRGGKIELGPIWDFDRSMESTDARDDDPYTWDGTGDATRYFDYIWWQQLFADPNFMQRWIDRWFELRQDVLSEVNIVSLIDSMAAEIVEGQARNFEIWPGPRTDYPYAFNAGALDGTWTGELEHLKAWLRERLAWIDSQFSPPPTIEPAEGRVPAGQEIVLSSTSGLVYYTTDGTDPRAPGGAISDSAILADEGAPLVCADTVSIVARTLADGAWSAPVAAGFREAGVADDATQLRITEINYHPYATTGAELAIDPNFDDEDFEFIELTNTGNHPIDLTNVALTGGVVFTFGGDAQTTLLPGDHVLAVANRDAFAARYGGGLPVAGVFARGRLSNSGERVVLVDRYGVVLHDFQYSVIGDWPARADGTGSTLEVLDTAGDYSSARNWRASDRYGGSPGFVPAGPVADVLINEVLGRSGGAGAEAIELHNRTTHAVDVSGWYLSDDPDALAKTAIADGTTIAAGAYLVLSRAEVGFALSGAEATEVWLVASGAHGRPVRFADQVQLAPADAGVSVGRWPNGDPAGFLFPMTEPTWGSANSGPRTGAVIVSEVYYHPPDRVISATTFVDGTAEGFTPVLGTWTVRDGGYEVTPGPEGDTVSILSTSGSLPVNFALSAALSIRSVAGFQQNGMLVFDYHGPTDFKFASAHVNGNKWRIGQRTASGSVFLAEAQVRQGIDVDAVLRVRVEIRGSSVVLRVNGVTFGHDFGTPLSDGRVGVGSRSGTPRFDQLKLEWIDDPRDFEFVELAGTTAAPIDLGGWRLEDAVQMTLPPGTTIAGSEVLVVVGFDPADADKAQSFREAFGIGASVTLLGPYVGKLDDAGAVVRLLDPGTAGTPPARVLADQAVFDASSPWPVEANGGGASLQRTAAAAFGSLPGSWWASAPSPGTARYVAMGDTNLDGAVNVDDVGPFAMAIADSTAYEARYRVPALVVADTDGDGAIDFDDIAGFVALLGASSPGITAAARTGPPENASKDALAAAPPSGEAAAATPSECGQRAPVPPALRLAARQGRRLRAGAHVTPSATRRLPVRSAPWPELADGAIESESVWHTRAM